MYGQITKFHAKLSVGVIASEDGRRLRFRKDEVLNLDTRLVGREVDFVESGGLPRDIVLLTGSPWAVFGRGAARQV